MIRVNLFTGMPVQGQGLDVLRRALLIAAGVLSGALVVGLTVLLIRTLVSAPPRTPAAAQTAPAPAAPPPPSRTPYRSLGLGPRIAYEISFTDRVLEALTTRLPAGMTPSLVTIDSFEVLRLAGRSPVKEQVTSLLGSLRGDDLKLSPRPQTVVTATADGAYEYTAEVRICFAPRGGADAVDSVLARLPAPTQSEPEARQRIERLAADANVAVRKGLRYVTTQKAGSYRRYVYRMDAAGTLSDFARMVRTLRAGHVPCAFGSVRITAGRSGRMEIGADVYVSARE